MSSVAAEALMAKIAGASGVSLPPVEAAKGRKAERISSDVVALQRRLRPGDILNTNPRKILKPSHRFFKQLSTASQGTVFGHSAMYAGGGEVIDPRPGGVVRRPLKDLALENKIVAIRPDVDRRTSQGAVRVMERYMRDQRLGVSTKSLILRGGMPTILSDRHEGRKQDLVNRAICSSLVANAYHQVPFNDERSIMNTRPVDIMKSDKVKVIGMVR